MTLPPHLAASLTAHVLIPCVQLAGGALSQGKAKRANPRAPSVRGAIGGGARDRFW